MPTISSNSINLSVKNASTYVSSIKNEERILSFFLGGISADTNNTNSELERNNSYKKASFFKKIEPSEIDVVTKKIKFGSTVFATWNPYSDATDNYYVVANNRVYLVIGNDEFNRSSKNETYIASVTPTHTSGIAKYGDGYEYLYLFTLSADNKVVSTNNLWIPVPDITYTQYAGRLLYKKIDDVSIQGITTNFKNPIIPLLSDSGTGASIKLRTVVRSSPSTTVSKRKYTIVGIEVENIGTSEYLDYDLNSSLSAVLTDLSAAEIITLENAITLGFCSNEGISLRNILQSRYAMITLTAETSDIESVIEQTEFTNFGVVEDITNDAGTKIFSSGSATKIVSNNVKITCGQYLSGATPTEDDFEIKTPIILQNKTKYDRGKTASRRVSGGGTVVSEIEIADKTTYQVNDRIKTGKSGSEVFLITAVSVPDIKLFSGKVLQTGSTTFSTGTAKTFVAQVIESF